MTASKNKFFALENVVCGLKYKYLEIENKLVAKVNCLFFI